jgi:hypothetical protein
MVLMEMQFDWETFREKLAYEVGELTGSLSFTGGGYLFPGEGIGGGIADGIEGVKQAIVRIRLNGTIGDIYFSLGWRNSTVTSIKHAQDDLLESLEQSWNNAWVTDQKRVPRQEFKVWMLNLESQWRQYIDYIESANSEKWRWRHWKTFREECYQHWTEWETKIEHEVIISLHHQIRTIDPSISVCNGSIKLLQKQKEEVGTQLAEELLKRKDIRDLICPHLMGFTGDIFTAANTVSQVLIPLILIGQLQMPLESVVFAAIGVLLLKTGVRIICPSQGQ